MFVKKKILIEVNERATIEIGKLSLELGVTRKHAIELLINNLYMVESLKAALKDLVEYEKGIM